MCTLKKSFKLGNSFPLGKFRKWLRRAAFIWWDFQIKSSQATFHVPTSWQMLTRKWAHFPLALSSTWWYQAALSATACKPCPRVADVCVWDIMWKAFQTLAWKSHLSVPATILNVVLWLTSFSVPGEAACRKAIPGNCVFWISCLSKLCNCH